MPNPFQNWTSEEVLAHNRRVARKNSTGQVNPHVHIPMPAKKRLRQSSKGPNQLERAAMEFVTNNYAIYNSQHQAITLKLANGVRYSPDIVGWMKESPGNHPLRLCCFEVKGPHSWDDAIVKLKVAAAQFPHAKFILLWKQNGNWIEQEILP